MYSIKRFYQFLVALLLNNLAIQVVVGLASSMPSRCRTEGKVTLLVPQRYTNHLTFTESLDSIMKRKAISIGYISQAPNKYYVQQGSPIISLGQDGICRALEDSFLYVPELSWFVELMFAESDFGHLASTQKSLGPTGLLELILKLKDVKREFQYERSQTYRNVPCKVYSARWHSTTGMTFIKYELFVPGDADKFKGDKADYFSVHAASYDFDKYSAQLDNSSFYKYKFILDYYNIDSIDNDEKRYDELQQDFNLPLGTGCSEVIAKFQPFLSFETFTMIYHQHSISSTIFMAYDHVGSYMRKELIGKSTSIWDFNEDFMYYLNLNSIKPHFSNEPTPYNLRQCSVLKITDEKLGPAFRPYEVVGKSLDVLKFLGAQFIANMGRGTVRELPCLIFETILKEPPSLFALSSEQLNRNTSSLERDYIVTYYVVEGSRLSPNAPKFEHQLQLLKGSFWPARITLFRRNKELGHVEFLDNLEISDFYLSLQGWTERPSELFMASYCFDDESDQVKIEADVKFPLIHEPDAKLADKALLTNNKFKLETDLIKIIFNIFAVSRMHLVDYELKLRPHHVDLDLIVSDRKEAKDLVYIGPGKLPNEISYESNRADWTDQSEESCVTLSSLLEEITMVIYCPAIGAELSMCIAVYDEHNPTYESVVNVDPLKPTCQVYKYRESTPPPSAVERIIGHKFDALEEFNFEAVIPGPVESTRMLRGVVKYFDISHEIQLIAISNYMFSLSPPGDDGDPLSTLKNVRHFDSLEYEQQSDCAKMCNLDATCKSYSYCQSTKHSCIVSTLDLRGSEVKDQLSKSSAAEGNQITVEGKYQLEFKDECSIHERDYLSMFSRADETISLSVHQVTKYPTASTTFECAKQSVDLELSYPDHQVTMFAYCASSSTCLLENLFTSTGESNANLSLAQGEEDRDEFGVEFNTPSVNNEVLCSVYRKKYQSYFMVSANVLKRNSATKQVEVALGSVEECARACWNRFGKDCVSFDYCNPDTCLINQVGSKTDGSNSETRTSCLHYDRNLKLDEIRRKHLIGRHEYIELEEGESAGSSFWSKLVTFSLVLIGFVVGLKFGVKVDNKMNEVRISRQSISACPEICASQTPDHQNGANLGFGGDSAAYINSNDDFRDAIRMEVIRNNDSQDDDLPLRKDF